LFECQTFFAVPPLLRFSQCPVRFSSCDRGRIDNFLDLAPPKAESYALGLSAFLPFEHIPHCCSFFFGAVFFLSSRPPLLNQPETSRRYGFHSFSLSLEFGWNFPFFSPDGKGFLRPRWVSQENRTYSFLTILFLSFFFPDWRLDVRISGIDHYFRLSTTMCGSGPPPFSRILPLLLPSVPVPRPGYRGVLHLRKKVSKPQLRFQSFTLFLRRLYEHCFKPFFFLSFSSSFV